MTIFLFGGGARGDILALPILRFVAALGCAVGVLTLERQHVVRNRAVLAFAVAIACLIAVHLVPLPPAVWQALPGREMIAANDQLAGLNGVWRPYSLAPGTTWNALYSLLVPLAVLLCGIQLDRDHLLRLVPVILTIGALSGLIGILQVIGDASGPLYFYRITNGDSAVGLFSNRNHHAVFLAALFPMLAWLAGRPAASPESARIRNWLCALAAIVLIPIVLVAGSRAGLLLSIVGILGAWRLYRPAIPIKVSRRGAARFDWRAPLVALAMLLIGVLTFVVSRAEAVSRLTGNAEQDEVRLKVWGPILTLGWKYFPAGAGIGSFVQVYRMDEPDILLGATYLNHAHNELLELWLTAGIPGLLLALVAVCAMVASAIAALGGAARAKPAGGLRATGALIVLILLLGSIADYPLRTPSLAALLIVGILWMRAPTDEPAGKPLEKRQAIV